MAFRSSDQIPTEEDYKTVEPAIQKYLDIVKPDKIIVFSKRIWDKGLKSEISWGNYLGEVQDEKYNKKSTLWKFNYENGLCFGIGVNHPSSRGYSPIEWSSLINKFLSEDYSSK